MIKVFTYLIGILFSLPVYASSPIFECNSSIEMHNKVIAFYNGQNRKIKQLNRLYGEKAQEYIIYYNALPPVTNLEADKVIIYLVSSPATVIEMFYLNGCYVEGHTYPFEGYIKIWMLFYEGEDV